MAHFFPSLENIERLTVEPTEGELHLLRELERNLNDDYNVYFNPYLDGDRPDIIILRKNHGAVIIEVKDWEMSNYRIDNDNRWYPKNNSKIRMSSPMQQAFKYKSHLFELHLPLLGFAAIKNINFYKTISCFVYYHKLDNTGLNFLYDHNITENKQSLKEKNKLNIKRLERDKNQSITYDNIKKLMRKIESINKNPIFQDHIYDEFTTLLNPPKFIESQGIKRKFDEDQSKYIQSSPNTKIKIKGVAGSGKTTVMAERAAHAHKRHQSTVLILTFNLSIKNYIKDKVKNSFRMNDIEFKNDKVEISNYHYFFKSQMNNLGLQLPIFKEVEEDEFSIISDGDEEINDNFGKLEGLSQVEKQELFNANKEAKNAISSFYSSVFKTDYFKGSENVIKYQTILVDEIQDFEVEWLEIIVNNFLAPNGEMVLLGDQNQNIYNRIINNKDFPITTGFGHWKNLKISYRMTDNSFIDMLTKFKNTFINGYDDNITFEKINNELGYSDIGYFMLKNSKKPAEDIYQKIQEKIAELRLHPNDVVIIASSIEILRDLQNLVYLNKKSQTDSTFESKEEYEEIEQIYLSKVKKQNEARERIELQLKSPKDNIEQNRLVSALEYSKKALRSLAIDKIKNLESYRKLKKIHFYANSGKLKLATVHSYKGFESQCVFLVMQPNDAPEMIYAGITRSSEHLVVFDLEDQKYAPFFKSILKTD